jgi:hypothetical protein
VERVAGAEFFGARAVLEVVQERGGIQESDGRNAERHTFIIEAHWQCGIL